MRIITKVVYLIISTMIVSCGPSGIENLPEYDPIVLVRRDAFAKGKIPTNEELKFGETWSCHDRTATGLTTVETNYEATFTPGELGIINLESGRKGTKKALPFLKDDRDALYSIQLLIKDGICKFALYNAIRIFDDLLVVETAMKVIENCKEPESVDAIIDNEFFAAGYATCKR